MPLRGVLSRAARFEKFQQVCHLLVVLHQRVFEQTMGVQVWRFGVLNIGHARRENVAVLLAWEVTGINSGSLSWQRIHKFPDFSKLYFGKTMSVPKELEG